MRVDAVEADAPLRQQPGTRPPIRAVRARCSCPVQFTVDVASLFRDTSLLQSTAAIDGLQQRMKEFAAMTLQAPAEKELRREDIVRARVCWLVLVFITVVVGCSLRRRSATCVVCS